MLAANSIKPYAINTGIITMKTLQDLMELQAKAIEKYDGHETFGMGQVFFSFSGHVNQMDVAYYPLGWDKRNDATEHKFSTYLTEDGIQAMYWWMVVNLRISKTNHIQ